MTTERELLTLAAKAAGIKLLFDPYGVPRDCTGMDPAMNIFAAKEWNPIIDDGDALRLAVKLKLIVTFDGGDGAHVGAGQRLGPFSIEEMPVKMYALDEELAATRRAIVRAAAEIERSFPWPH